MNRDELLRECIEAENFGLDNPGFTVAVKGLYTAKKVKIDRDLYAENLGHYPDGFSDVMTHTHLFIRCSDVRQMNCSWIAALKIIEPIDRAPKSVPIVQFTLF